MANLNDINEHVDNLIQIQYNHMSPTEIIAGFEMKLERAKQILAEIKEAQHLNHLSKSGLVSHEQFQLLKRAINYLFEHTSDIISDINFVNSSGIHTSTDPTVLRFTIDAILERADKRYVGESLWRSIKSQCGLKERHFSDELKKAGGVDESDMPAIVRKALVESKEELQNA